MIPPKLAVLIHLNLISTSMSEGTYGSDEVENEGLGLELLKLTGQLGHK